MKANLFLVDGFETVEALAVLDILKRGGVEVETVSVMDSEYVTSAQQVTIKADVLFSECSYDDTQLFFLPGGPGTSNYEKNEEFLKLIKDKYNEGKRIAAICAAPSILGHLGLLENKNATCFPGFEKELYGANILKDRVVTDKTITTSRGMGTSIDLGLELIRLIVSEEKAKEVAASTQYI